MEIGADDVFALAVMVCWVDAVMVCWLDCEVYVCVCVCDADVSGCVLDVAV